MPAKTPLALMKEKFGEKSKLVEAVEKFTGEELWVARTNKDKGLAHVSNAKLLRLHATFTEVKEKFGTREKLVDAILELQKRSKDVGLKQKLSTWPVPRLFDAYRSATKRSAGPSGEDGARRSPKKPAETPVRTAPKTKSATKRPGSKPAGKTAKSGRR